MKTTRLLKADMAHFTLEKVFSDHIKSLNIPEFSGVMIGHIENKFTIPLA